MPSLYDETTQLNAAKAWAQWESSIVHLEHNQAGIDEYNDPQRALAIARIENHYFVHRCWLASEFALLENIQILADIPIVIVQGRYDMCTPIESAWELQQALPHARLVVTIAGHSGFEPANQAALVAATDAFASL